MIFRDNLYFISEHSNESIPHGGIGPVDIEMILKRNNAIPITFPHQFSFSAKAKIARLAYLVKTSVAVKRGSTVVFQHPLYARMNKLLLEILRRQGTVNIICLIADIDGIKDGNDKLLQAEKLFLSCYDYFIVHNPNMRAWLKSFHPAAKTSFLHCFDFLATYKDFHRTKTNTIVFAGNLSKSKFLEKLHICANKSRTLNINLYGPGITDAMLQSANVAYKGVHPAYSLPSVIEGSFGLIWDGDGIDTPSGNLGDYMFYINHHKLSLYIVCNLPVIIHESTGSADFVKRFNIGLTVRSLFEVEDKLQRLSEKDYGTMVQNMQQLAKDITSGNFLQNALGELLPVIGKEDKV